jgi:hypothetical protein
VPGWGEDRGIGNENIHQKNEVNIYGQLVVRAEEVAEPYHPRGISVLVVMAGLVTIVGLPTAASALIAGLVVLAMIGLTHALVGAVSEKEIGAAVRGYSSY